MPSFKSLAFAAYAVLIATSVVAFTEDTDSIARRTTQPLINAPSKDDGIGNNILNNWDLTAIIAGNGNKAAPAKAKPAHKKSAPKKSKPAHKSKPKHHSPSKPKAKPAPKAAPSPVGSIINAPSQGDGILNDSGNNAKGFAGIINNLNGKRGEKEPAQPLFNFESKDDGVGNNVLNNLKGVAIIKDNLNGLLNLKRDQVMAKIPSRRSTPNRLEQDHYWRRHRPRCDQIVKARFMAESRALSSSTFIRISEDFRPYQLLVWQEITAVLRTPFRLGLADTLYGSHVAILTIDYDSAPEELSRRFTLLDAEVCGISELKALECASEDTLWHETLDAATFPAPDPTNLPAEFHLTIIFTIEFFADRAKTQPTGKVITFQRVHSLAMYNFFLPLSEQAPLPHWVDYLKAKLSAPLKEPRSPKDIMLDECKASMDFRGTDDEFWAACRKRWREQEARGESS
ncbi:hypothetical protein RQP46_009802 [Phenoliferia psychrophenolica]